MNLNFSLKFEIFFRSFMNTPGLQLWQVFGHCESQHQEILPRCMCLCDPDNVRFEILRSLSLYQTLWSDHLLDSSWKDESNKWQVHRVWWRFKDICQKLSFTHARLSSSRGNVAICKESPRVLELDKGYYRINIW